MRAFPEDPSPAALPATGDAAPRRRVALPIDLDAANAELIALWLAGEGWELCPAGQPANTPALILVEIAFPRQGEHPRLQAIATAWPGVPVIVLSPTFFAGLPCRGEVAQQLGAAAVLATPLQRERLLAALRELTERPP